MRITLAVLVLAFVGVSIARGPCKCNSYRHRGPHGRGDCSKQSRSSNYCYVDHNSSCPDKRRSFFGARYPWSRQACKYRPATTKKPIKKNPSGQPVCRCGVERNPGNGITQHIIGGSEIDTKNKYPWLVMVRNGGSRCGGTLVASKYVITAAHCVDTWDRRRWKSVPATVNQVSVLVGDHDVYKDGETYLKEKLVKVQSITIHNDYKKPSPWSRRRVPDDMAILELDEELDLETYTPACIAIQGRGRWRRGMKVTAAGWGLTSSHPFSSPDVPHEVQLQVSECWPRPEKDLCAGGSGKSWWKGDSGGPVTFKQGDQHTLIGVISGGNPGEEGVAGKMIYYRNWLEKNLGDAVKCRM